MPLPSTSLLAIQNKVRLLTRSPSVAQLTVNALNEYINTFVLYDFPEHLRLFNLRETFTFTTNPFQDVYYIDIASYGGAANASSNPLYNFKNEYLTVHPPVYIAGFNSFYSQSREQFFNIYPKINSISHIAALGDGATLSFSGIVNTTQSIIPSNMVQQIVLLKDNVTFASVDIYGNACTLIDIPILDATTGNPTIFGQLVPPFNTANPPAQLLLSTPYMSDPGFPITNYINYLTGQFVITFTTPPAIGAQINSETVPQITSLPQALLFYDNQFTVRPVPDKPYRVNFEVYVLPTALLQNGQSPDLNEWWQYIAYGAAKKVLEDRTDMDTVNAIMPEFKKQEALCQRRTIVQYTNERTATIYTEQTGSGGGTGGWGVGGGSF